MNIIKEDITNINDVNCIKTNLVYKYLNIPYDTCRRQILKDKEIEIIKLKNSNFITLSTLNYLHEKKEFFWKEHINFQKAKEQYGLTVIKNKSRIKIPYYAKTLDIKSEWACIKEEIENVVLEKQNYILREEAKKILNLSDDNFKKTVIDFDVKVGNLGLNYAYLKEDIYFLKEQQLELGIRYLPYSTVIKDYGNAIINHVNSYLLPSFAKRKDIFPPKSMTYYDKFEIEEYLANREKRELYHNIDEDTLLETFKQKLSILEEFKNFNELPYTNFKWMSYVADYLNTINRNKRGQIKVINNFVELTCLLEQYLISLNNCEIYSLSTKQINTLLKSIPENRKAMLLYGFIKIVAQDIELKIQSVKDYNKGFIFSKVDNPAKKLKTNKDIYLKDIYDFNVYKSFFNFLTDIKFHITNSLNKSLSARKKGVYLSTWLYLLLHLNNAWRHGDVKNFPRLYLDDLIEYYQITSLDWFEHNLVSLDLARQVIAKVNKYEFTVSKTSVEGHFFCSNNLAPTFATALLMLEIYLKYDYIGTVKELNSPVMCFFNKYNEPAKKGFKSFLNRYSEINFEFGSKKMNKTILTYIYELSDDKDSFLFSKYMRSHTKDNTILHYLNINKSDIEFLTEQLFIRGEFGYIYDTLIDIALNPNISLEEKTSNISLIKNNFGDELKIEASLGLLNYFNDEKREILNMIYNEGYDYVLKTLNNIYMSKLPSRDENIQCLFSLTGCVCQDLDRCIDCKYSIPTIYALNVICESLKDDFKKYMSYKNIPQKIKISAKIYKKKNLIKQSIQRYGKDYVYSMLEMSNYQFLDTLSRIEKSEELLNLLKEKY